MVKLKEGGAELGDLIIFIDDPISSLDSNHLFFTASLIQTELGDARQLIVSTHNFEFFSLLKRWMCKRGGMTPKDHARFFWIEKITGEGKVKVKLTQLPDVLLRHESEYCFLFSILWGFKASPYADHERLYGLPNIARRFLEAFLAFMTPKPRDLRARMELLFDDPVELEAVYRFVNVFSNNQSLERALQFPDRAECIRIIEAILRRIEVLDLVHFQDLVSEAERAA